MQEHKRCESSHVFQHIYGCEEYPNVFKTEQDTAPNLTQFRKQLYVYFTALSTYFPNWYEQTAFESLVITKLQHTQLKYKKNEFDLNVYLSYK